MAPPVKRKGVQIEFSFQESQTRLFKYVTRNGGTYLQLLAPQCLEIGGQRSGKTTGKLMYGVENYCIPFAHCDILVLRRTIPELDAGVIQDFKHFVPAELYDFNHTTRIATFKNNGSRVVFAGCVRKGSLIDTARGLVPIEDVTTSDSVLTRKGYRKVQWSGMTGVKPTIKLDNLWLTPEHEVYCDGKFSSAQEIVCRRDSGKTVHLLRQKSSYLKALCSGDTPNLGSTGTGTITREGRTESTSLSTLPFTNKLTGKFQQVLRSITKITTAITTPQIISFSLPSGNIENITSRGFIPASERRASFASPNSRLATRPGERLALRNVEEYRLGESRRDTSPAVAVYDLTVEDQHEYFANGILVHNCANNVERDIERYLGQAYPYILVDECAQFSPDVWQRLYARNLVNAACEMDDFGNLPIPAIVGCTNPIGAFWEFYHSVFVNKEPADKEEGCKRAVDGSWWAPDSGEMRCIYNPKDYAFNHTTVMQNPAYLKRDPGIINRLRALPKAKMEKFLLGLMDRQEGQYFDCFSEEYHVVDLREDPEAIIWQDWQPVWGGQDWGMGHWNAFYLFTKALVRRTIGSDYVTKTVCFREVAPETTGHTNIAFADMIEASAYYPRLPDSHPQFSRISGKKCKVSAIYFSHEKFSRVMEAHSPADDYSNLLRKRGLPPVSRGTRDRIGSASYIYNQLKGGRLVILRTCPGIIQAFPQLPRDPKQLDDVLKLNTKADDRYDAFRLGLYGEYKARGTPQAEYDKQKMEEMTPLARIVFAHKKRYEQSHEGEAFKQPEYPTWMTKLM